MSYIKNPFIYLVLFTGLNLLNAQSDFESLGETSFAINTNVANNYTINFAINSRYYLYQDEAINFENRQLDFIHFSTFGLDYNHSLSLGLQYRLRASIDGESNELRLTQQFNNTQRHEAMRFGHRVRLEQRFFENLTILRSRYRFAIDFPLNGTKLDIGEAYLVNSMEALISHSRKLKPELGYRVTTQIGCLISEALKLQFGLEYRFEAFNLDTEQKLFLLTSAVLKI